jgi:hypothetical protein
LFGLGSEAAQTKQNGDWGGAPKDFADALSLCGRILTSAPGSVMVWA